MVTGFVVPSNATSPDDADREAYDRPKSGPRAELAFPLEVEAFEQDEAEFRLIIRKVAAH